MSTSCFKTKLRCQLLQLCSFVACLQENMKKFNRNRQVFCSILTNRCCSAVGTVFDADTIIFYDTDLNPSMDARTQEWCDKIGRSKDIHIYRWYYKNKAFWFCFYFLCSLFRPQIKQFYLITVLLKDSTCGFIYFCMSQGWRVGILLRRSSWRMVPRTW